MHKYSFMKKNKQEIDYNSVEKITARLLICTEF